MTPQQNSLFPPEIKPTVQDDWCADDWETPDQVAKFMASLLTRDDYLVVEPSAGTGQIAKYLPNTTICTDVNRPRCEAGATIAPHCYWACADWLDPDVIDSVIAPYYYWLCGDGLVLGEGGIDCIIGNPPFSLGIEFLAVSAQRLADKGRILFLLPSEYFQSQARAIALQKTGLVITHQWAIAGRVGYLKQGEVFNQRQCYDSVFEFKLNGTPAIEIVDPYGKLK